MKVVIFEDNFNDVKEVYGNLNKSNELHIYYFSPLEHTKRTIDTIFETASHNLKKFGFNEKHIYRGFIPNASNEIMKADVYFCDSLDGQIYELIKHLPGEVKENFYVSSNNFKVRESLKRGHKIIDKDPSAVLRVLTSYHR